MVHIVSDWMMSLCWDEKISRDHSSSCRGDRRIKKTILHKHKHHGYTHDVFIRGLSKSLWNKFQAGRDLDILILILTMQRNSGLWCQISWSLYWIWIPFTIATTIAIYYRNSNCFITNELKLNQNFKLCICLIMILHSPLALNLFRIRISYILFVVGRWFVCASLYWSLLTLNFSCPGLLYIYLLTLGFLKVQNVSLLVL